MFLEDQNVDSPDVLLDVVRKRFDPLERVARELGGRRKGQDRK